MASCSWLCFSRAGHSNQPVPPLPIKRPFLPFVVRVAIPKGAACFGVNPAGDNVKVGVVGVVVGDKNRAGVLHADSGQGFLGRLFHFGAGRSLPRAP